MLDVLTITLNPAIDQTVYIDNFEINRVNRVNTIQNDAGGKGINVAAYLASSNLKIGATGFLGATNSQIFEELFKKLNIENKFVYLDGETRTNVKIVDKNNETVTDVNQSGFEPTLDDIKSLEEAIFSKKEANWYVFSGSLPKGLNDDIYKIWIERAHELGIKVALDASGEALIKAVEAKPNLIKPNNFELAQLVDFEGDFKIDDIFKLASKLVDEGIETVCVSMGEDGALIVNEKEAYHATVLQAEVNTTVGAGDALLSGLIFSKINNENLEDSIKIATSYSLSALKTVGPYLSSKKELEKLSNDVKIVPIGKTK